MELYLTLLQCNKTVKIVDSDVSCGYSLNSPSSLDETNSMSTSTDLEKNCQFSIERVIYICSLPIVSLLLWLLFLAFLSCAEFFSKSTFSKNSLC